MAVSFCQRGEGGGGNVKEYSPYIAQKSTAAAKGKWSKWLSSPSVDPNGYFLNGWGDWSRHGSFPPIHARLNYHQKWLSMWEKESPPYDFSLHNRAKPPKNVQVLENIIASILLLNSVKFQIRYVHSLYFDMFGGKFKWKVTVLLRLSCFSKLPSHFLTSIANNHFRPLTLQLMNFFFQNVFFVVSFYSNYLLIIRWNKIEIF